MTDEVKEIRYNPDRDTWELWVGGRYRLHGSRDACLHMCPKATVIPRG